MNTVYDNILNNLNRLTERLDKINMSVSSGKRYSRPSDAPSDLVHALGYRKALREISQYRRNISDAKGHLATMETALEKMQEQVIRAKELAIQGANDTENEASRKMLANELRNILDEVVSLSNTQHNGRYIFAGTKTDGYPPGEKPFMLETILAGDVQTMEVRYQGGSEDLYYEYAPAKKIVVARNGEEAIARSGVFETLIGLIQTLENNNEEDPQLEAESIQTHISRLDEVLDYLNAQRADIGARMNRLEIKETVYDDLELTNKENLSAVEDTDLLEAIAELRAKETAYQAALSSAAKVMNLSLVNYL
ncbi:flagellar hook-associated protein FlgL [Thermosulfuriphilus ammonigenes]|nr:flagellar hook-associated protein FlgL [Thermosulfuriphilus ammonigenes]